MYFIDSDDYLNDVFHFAKSQSYMRVKKDSC